MKTQWTVSGLFHGKVYCALLCMTLLLLSIPLRLYAKDIQDVGYDENTEITIKCKVVKMAPTLPATGFQSIFVKSGERIFRVFTAPLWFLRQIGLNLKDGDKAEIVGSKFFSEDGVLCLLARSIKLHPSGHIYLLRDKSCRPIWHTKGACESSCLRIFYTKP